MGLFTRLVTAAVFALAAMAGAQAQARTQLLVYTTYLTEHLDLFKKAFEARHPEIDILWHRDSTGTLTARLVAEAGAPKADAIFGLAATSLVELSKRGALEPYAPQGLADLRPSFRDEANPPAWIGMSAWVAAVCFNRIEAQKLGLPKPKSWHDLADPRFKGRISMPDPASAGSGFITVSAWLQTLGEEKAWALMEKLHPNVAVYEKSGSKPCSQAAAGEFAVGVSHDLAASQLAARGAPIDIVVMEEGGGWEMDAAAIVKGTAKPDAAKKLMDWAASREANELYARFVNLMARPDVKPSNPNYPEAVAKSMIRNDLAWASANRERILAEWARRFGPK
jgi:iron(III) transport system substrate-binding protein